jgi:hypothetical protein
MNGYSPPPGRGELVWFNEEEDHGVLAAESGARIAFVGAAFVDGERPEGRVGGLPVEFTTDGMTVLEVRLVEPAAGRRARRRGR